MSLQFIIHCDAQCCSAVMYVDVDHNLKPIIPPSWSIIEDGNLTLDDRHVCPQHNDDKGKEEARNR